jgi:hypothetical protein
MKKIPGVPTVMPSQQPLFQTLTAREQAFVMHPDVFTDPVAAAKAVGYADTTAQAKAYTMRKDLLYFIMPLHEARLEKTGVTADRIKDELAAIAFANEADYYDTVDTKDGTLKFLRDLTRLPPAMQRAIKKINYTNTVMPDGSVIQEVESIELYDKLGALKELAEIFGLHDARLRQPADSEDEDEKVMEYMEPDELDVVIKAFDKATARAKAVGNKKRDRQAIDVKPTRK